jgi:hypothetical protein
MFLVKEVIVVLVEIEETPREKINNSHKKIERSSETEKKCRKSHSTIKMLEAQNTMPSSSKGKDTDSSSDVHDVDPSELSVSSDKRDNSSSADDSSNTSPHCSSNGSSSGRVMRFGFFQSSKDDRHINSAKCAFLTFLLAAAVGLGVTIYFTTAADQQGDFQANVSAANTKAPVAVHHSTIPSLQSFSSTCFMRSLSVRNKCFSRCGRLQREPTYCL